MEWIEEGMYLVGWTKIEEEGIRSFARWLGLIPRKEEDGRWMDWAGDENEEVAADGMDGMDP